MTKGDNPIGFGVSKAPEDPKEKKKWASQMMSIQIGMWLGDGVTCLQCKYKYQSVDDFMERSPVKGHTKDMSFVCKSCYPKYRTSLKENCKE